MFKPVIFREYDIRGVVNKDYDSAFAYDLARAYITFIKRRGVDSPKVSIGNDARLSSPEIVQALERGFIESGAKVFKLGLVTTPISYFSTFTMDIDGAIMVTGSHNPPEYNGFKISVGKATISGEDIQELRKIIEAEDFVNGNGSSEEFDIFPSYVEKYKSEFEGLKNIKVVLDCGNGAAGCIVRKMYEAVGLNPIILFEEPDGTFPNHHPDPTVEKYVVDLKKKVLETGADIGIGFDGDADRIGVVDNQGNFLLGDDILTLISRDILKENPGAKIIGDVKCSDRFYNDIKKHGGQPIMWKTGHSLVKKKVKEEKAPFGGELSCHVFFADRNFGYDDAPYAGLRLIEILSKEKRSISEILSDYPKAFSTPEIRIDTTEEKKVSIVEELKKQYSKTGDYTTNLIDGIRISFPDGWALARPSNTQPVLSMRFESLTEDGLNRIRNEIEKVVNPLL